MKVSMGFARVQIDERNRRGERVIDAPKDFFKQHGGIDSQFQDKSDTFNLRMFHSTAVAHR